MANLCLCCRHCDDFRFAFSNGGDIAPPPTSNQCHLMKLQPSQHKIFASLLTIGKHSRLLTIGKHSRQFQDRIIMVYNVDAE